MCVLHGRPNSFGVIGRRGGVIGYCTRFTAHLKRVIDYFSLLIVRSALLIDRWSMLIARYS